MVYASAAFNRQKGTTAPHFDSCSLTGNHQRRRRPAGQGSQIDTAGFHDDHGPIMPTPAPVAPKKFLTNQGDNTLSKRLATILPLTQDFDCLVGYFFISGFFRDRK